MAEFVPKPVQQFVPKPVEEGSMFTDIGRGIASGAVTVGQGIVELGALATDLAFDTDYAKPTTAFFEDFKQDAGIDPQGTAGEVTEEIVAFGIGFLPIAGWLGRAGMAAKGGKALGALPKSRFFRTADRFGKSKLGKTLLSSRARLAGTTALAATGYEAITTPDGRPTVSDSFDVLPDILKTEESVAGLTGRAEALRRIRNRLRSGAEAGLASAAFDAVLPVVGAGTRAVGQLPVVGEGASAAARFTNAAFARASDSLLRLPAARRTNEAFRKWFSATGGVDERIFEELSDTIAVGDTAQRAAVNYLRDWDRQVKRVVRGQRLLGKGKTATRKAERDLYEFLTGNNSALDAYPKEVQEAAERMRRLGAEFEDRILTDAEKALEGAAGFERKQKLTDTLRAIRDHQREQKSYLRRLYQRFENPETFYKNLDLKSKDYKEAVDEVAENLINMPGSQFRGNPVAAREAAETRVNQMLGLDAVNRGKSPDAAIKDVLTEIKQARERTFLPPSAKLDIADDMFIKREPLMDQSPKLRQLLGEMKDPKEAFIRTISDSAHTTSAVRFYESLYNDKSLTLDLGTALRQLDAEEGRPMIVDANIMAREPVGSDFLRPSDPGSRLAVQMSEPDEEAIAALRNYGYRQLGEVDARHPFLGSYGDLTGMYVAPELHDALTTSGRLGQTAMNEAAALAVQAKGLSQRMTVVQNPLSQIRNIYGGFYFLGANGNLGRNMDFTDTLKMFAGNLDNLDDAGAEKLARTMGELGVMDTALVTSAIRQFGKLGEDLTTSGKVQKAIDGAIDNVPLMKWLERTYSDTDSFFKVMTVLGEQSKLKSAIAKAGLSENTPALQQELVRAGLAKRTASAAVPDADFLTLTAADLTKDVMPTYPRVGRAVRGLDMVPLFGNFTSFASENIRNSVNTLQRGLNELAFRVSPELRAQIGEAAARTLERQIRGIGSQRLMSYVSTASVLPMAATRASMSATGMTEEDMEALYRETPPYLKGHELTPIRYDKENAKVEYIDQSYVNPYAFVTDAAKAALREYAAKGELNASEVNQIASAAWTGLISFAEPFGAESLVFERLRDVLPQAWVGRGGETQTGAKIYVEGDSLGDKLSKSFTHTIGGFIPGFMRQIAEERGGRLEPGRLTRGMFDIPGAQGQEYTTAEEAARLVSGFTPMVLDLKKDFWYNGAAYAPRRTEAKTQAYRAIKNNDSTVDDMVSGWNTYLDNLYREQSKLYAHVQAARELGLSDRDIIFNLINKANLGKDEVAAIMRGEFYPTIATDELIEQIETEIRFERQPRTVTDVPYRELSQLSVNRLREPLNGRIYEEEIDTGRKGFSWFEVAPGLKNQPFEPRPVQTEGAAPFTPRPVTGQGPRPAPQVQPPSAQDSTPVSPGLLGDNPVEVMRNLEIAQRTSGQ